MSTSPPDGFGVKPVSIAVVGSCVSRDPFAFLPSPAFQVTSYLARQSFAGLTGPPLAYEPQWYDGLAAFERKCVVADLEKNADYWRFESGADLLMIDYIDERFNLLSVGASLVCDTKHIRQPGFLNAYAPAVWPRDSEAVWARWKAGAALFFARARRTLPARRLVLHEAYWAPALRDREGAVTPFPAALAPVIAQNNTLLRRMYELTRREWPGVAVVRPGREVLYADPDHRWSREPFHYVEAYYAQVIAQVTGVVANLRRDGLLPGPR